jgi:hypothetical protein
MKEVYRMKPRMMKLIALVGASLLTLAVIIMTALPGDEPGEKITSVGSASWEWLSFDEFIARADRIVYGRVAGFDDVIVYETIISEYNTSIQVYTPVIIEVIEWIKGDHPADQITFYQMGGETETRIHIIRDIMPLALGETTLLFINDRGGMIHPGGVLPVVDGRINQIPLLPDEYISQRGGALDADFTMDLHEYISLVSSRLP